MNLFPVLDLARVSFPGQQPGWFLMLEGYFDDGGTHDDSEVMVWGGVMGDTKWFARLEREWLPLLNCPMDGKAAIKQFYASHLMNSWEDFEGYLPPERDVVLKAFRDAIINAGLVPVSFAVVLKDWNELIVGKYRQIFGSAEEFAFMSCTMAAYRMAAHSKSPVSIQFDTARLEASRQPIIDSLREGFKDALVNVGFSRCQDSTGLQAADLVAHEAYVMSLNSVRSGNDNPRLHFVRLLEGVPDAFGFIMRKQEIEPLLALTDTILERGDLLLSGKPGGFQNVFNSLFSGHGV